MVQRRPDDNRAKDPFRAGVRVTRDNASVSGTVIEATEKHIKVKWEDGRTSYYMRGKVMDVAMKGE